MFTDLSKKNFFRPRSHNRANYRPRLEAFEARQLMTGDMQLDEPESALDNPPQQALTVAVDEALLPTLGMQAEDDIRGEDSGFGDAQLNQNEGVTVISRAILLSIRSYYESLSEDDQEEFDLRLNTFINRLNHDFNSATAKKASAQAHLQRVRDFIGDDAERERGFGNTIDHLEEIIESSDETISRTEGPLRFWKSVQEILSAELPDQDEANAEEWPNDVAVPSQDTVGRDELSSVDRVFGESDQLDDLIIGRLSTQIIGEAFRYFTPREESNSTARGQDKLESSSDNPDVIQGSNGFDTFGDFTPQINVEDIPGGKSISLSWLGNTLTGTFQFVANERAKAELSWNGEPIEEFTVEPTQFGYQMITGLKGFRIILEYHQPRGDIDEFWVVKISKSGGLADVLPGLIPPTEDSNGTLTLKIDFGENRFQVAAAGKYDGFFGEHDFDRILLDEYFGEPRINSSSFEIPTPSWNTPQSQLDFRVWTHLESLGFGDEAKHEYYGGETDWLRLMNELGVEIPEWYPR